MLRGLSCWPIMPMQAMEGVDPRDMVALSCWGFGA